MSQDNQRPVGTGSTGGDQYDIHSVPQGDANHIQASAQNVRINTAGNLPSRDIVNVEWANELDVRTQEGNDEINAGVYRSGFIHAGSGDDRVKVRLLGGHARVGVHGGRGDDTLTLHPDVDPRTHTRLTFEGGAGNDAFSAGVHNGQINDYRLTRIAADRFELRYGENVMTLLGVEEMHLQHFRSGGGERDYTIYLGELGQLPGQLENAPLSQIIRDYAFRHNRN